MNALARIIAAPRLPRNVVLLAFTSFCADVSSEMPEVFMRLRSHHLLAHSFSVWRAAKSEPLAEFGEEYARYMANLPALIPRRGTAPEPH